MDDYVDIDLTRLCKKVKQLEKFDLFHLAELVQDEEKNIRVAKISREDFLSLLNDIENEITKYKELLKEDKDETV